MKTLFIIMAAALLGSCSPELKKNSYKARQSGVYWEKKKYDHVQRKKLNYYVQGWGVSNCPVYGQGPVRRDVMKRYHYHRQRN